MTKMLSTFFLSEFTREEGGQGSVSSVLHTNRSGRLRMEVASDASAWPVAITITLVREVYQLAPNDAQKRNLRVWEGEGVCLLENRTGVESVAYVTNSTRRGT